MQLTTLEGAVTHVWSRGWQPADLAGYVRRYAGAQSERLIVDVIAAEMRRYATATVDPHWQAQLETLGTVVWWGRDELFFDRWAQRQRVTAEAAARSATALLRMLERVPELPLLCAVPGRSRPGAPSETIDQRLLDRVRALLAKAESTDFPEEAETYSAKAQELMARHSIDHALLSAGGSGGGDGPGGRRMQIDNPYETPKALLLDVTAKANRSRSVWSRDLGFSTVLGFPGDVAATELLYTSLLVQATAAMVHAGSPGDGRTASFRRSFLTGYAHRIEQRLNQATVAASESAAQEYGQAMLPVLASRDEAVQETVQELFPTLQRVNATVGNRSGWAAGQAAADRASLQPQHARLVRTR